MGIHLPYNAPHAVAKATPTTAATAEVNAAAGADSTADTSAEEGDITYAEHEMAANLYEGIAHSEHPHPYSLLYWQILFRIYHHRFSVNPDAPILVLLNSC